MEKRSSKLGPIVFPIYLAIIGMFSAPNIIADLNIDPSFKKHVYIGLVAFIIIYIIIIVKYKFSKWGINIKNPIQDFMLQQIQENPQILQQSLSDEVKDKEKIINEIQKIKGIKEIKKIDNNAMEILTIYEDNSEHWYRATTDQTKKIVSLNRYS